MAKIREEWGGFASGVKEGNIWIEKVKVSFRNKVVGTKEAKTLKLVEDLSRDDLAIITYREKDDLHPKVSFSANPRTTLIEPYKKTIVIKVLGKHFSYTAKNPIGNRIQPDYTRPIFGPGIGFETTLRLRQCEFHDHYSFEPPPQPLVLCFTALSSHRLPPLRISATPRLRRSVEPPPQPLASLVPTPPPSSTPPSKNSVETPPTVASSVPAPPPSFSVQQDRIPPLLPLL
ncbi:hypothetical protein PIB30_001141 [Stylosanthes scabra]|uniref:Uncharacterized protein n=1 Tax=Stylosanthes scabra TaxID=79078 RepID=A0ABU6V4T2_9FABA|nr:hypothetical protein [Stylosanthes scabra]